MTKEHKDEAMMMYKMGHTFYGIAYQLEQWFHKIYTETQIQKALGVEDNPVGNEKFRRDK